MVPFAESIRARIEQGEHLVGVWQFLMEPAITSMVGDAGFDFVLIDTEHSSATIESVKPCVLAARTVGIHSIVRVAERGLRHLIQQVLELGVDGVLVPTIETADHVRDVVAASRYPPTGERGHCPMTSAAGWTRTPGYEVEANDRTWVAGLVETPLGLENLDEILAVEGLDAVMIGHGDLGCRLGVGPSDPGLQELLKSSISRVASSKKIWWQTHGAAVDGMQPEVGKAGGMACVGLDAGLLVNGLRQLRQTTMPTPRQVDRLSRARRQPPPK